MGEQVGEGPRQGGEQVGLGSEVEHDHVARDELVPAGLRHVGERLLDLVEEVPGPLLGGPALAQDLADEHLDLGHGRALPGLARGEGDRGPQRVDERLGGVEPVEGVDQRLDVRGRGRLLAGPRRQAEAVADAPALVEEVEGARAAERGELGVHGAIEVVEVALDPLVAEQLVRRVADLREQLVGDLGADHVVGGQAERRVPLRPRRTARRRRPARTRRRTAGRAHRPRTCRRGASRCRANHAVGLRSIPVAAPTHGTAPDHQRRHRLDPGEGRWPERSGTASDPGGHLHPTLRRQPMPARR